MPPHLNRPHHHAPVAPSPSSSTTTSTPESSPQGLSNAFTKPRFFSWRVLGGIFATMLVIGWVFIIVILIQEEKWQLVLVAWLLLYAAAHFCYWYFKRHHLLSIQSQLCGRTRGNVGTLRNLEKGRDAPPSYEDILKSEAPPPSYDLVVEGSPKLPHKQTSSSGFPLFSLHGLPKVFGKSRPSSCQLSSPSTSSAPEASTSSSNLSSNSSTLKKTHGGKSSSSALYYHPPSPPPSSISRVIPTDQSCGWKPEYSRGDPPSYSDSFVDIESQVIAPRSHTPSSPTTTRYSARSVSRGSAEAVMNEALRPIFSPIYKNTATPSSSSSSCRPQISRDTAIMVSVPADANEKKSCSKRGSC